MLVSETGEARIGPHDPKFLTRRGILLVAAIMATLAAVLWAFYTRQVSSEAPPFTLANLVPRQLGPHWIGLAAQLTIVPTGLVYLFSYTRLFRRVIGGDTARHDRLKMFGALALILCLSILYEMGIGSFGGHEPIVFGLRIAIIGGLLGGWQMGLGLGFMAALFCGTFDFIPLYDLPNEIQSGEIWIRLGQLKWPGWLEILRNNYANMWVLSPLWAGLFSGLLADVVGKRRFVPAVALALGASAELGVGYLTAIAAMPPNTNYITSSMLVSGLALASIALTVRNAQAEVTYRKAQAAELALARAELRALRAQINPHFLFNALNTIRYFVRKDSETARALLLNLSEVFQRALRCGDIVTLQDELSYVEAYLALEKARLDTRLCVVWSVRAEDWLNRPVPTLILQPIVENAVVHGISQKPEGGTLSISVEQQESLLVILIEDDGLGIEPRRLAQILDPQPGVNGNGIGLSNVDGRLRALYGPDYRLIIESEVGKGTRVRMRIPARLTPSPLKSE